MHTHLSDKDRTIIGCLLEEKKSERYIADKLGRASSTICREIKRNAPARKKYCAQEAQRCSKARRHEASRKPRKMNPKLVRAFKKEMVRRNSVLSAAQFLPMSASGLYDWLRRDYVAKSPPHAQRAHLYMRQFAPHDRLAYGVYCYGKRKTRKGASPMRDATPIAKRPAIVERKTRCGDVEVDTMIWANDARSLTIRDRKSSRVWKEFLPAFTADAVADCIIRRLRGCGIKTITSDGGAEFVRWRKVEKALKIKWYVCDPYCPHQRGGVEHANGIIRRMARPDIAKMGLAKSLRRAEKCINNRPTKRLNFRTPAEVFGL